MIMYQGSFSVRQYFSLVIAMPELDVTAIKTHLKTKQPNWVKAVI